MCDSSENSPGTSSGKSSREHEPSRQLIAWLDHELAEPEAAAVERHLRACEDCRRRVAAYERMANALNAWCDATVAASLVSSVPGTARVCKRLPRWVTVVAAAAAAIAVLFLALPHRSIEHPAQRVQMPAGSGLSAPTPAGVTPAAGVRKSDIYDHSVAAIRRAPVNTPSLMRATPKMPAEQLQAAAPAVLQHAERQFARPAIQITIPAEAMFPPGAVPPGVNFTASLTIAADGSAQGLVLEPLANSSDGGHGFNGTSFSKTGTGSQER